ncbi:MAG: hypothetical protein M3112_05475 [Actinomycetia bacterium]|nr:hypothetical protein [Actinomycetes bacterium]
MKRRLRVLIVFAATIAMVMALNVGAASADHGDNPNSPFGATAAEAPSPSPVGKHIAPENAPGHIAFHKQPAQVVTALGNNPNCPLHY